MIDEAGSERAKETERGIERDREKKKTERKKERIGVFMGFSEHSIIKHYKNILLIITQNRWSSKQLWGPKWMHFYKGI